jgi:hypothetical protein
VYAPTACAQKARIRLETAGVLLGLTAIGLLVGRRILGDAPSAPLVGESRDETAEVKRPEHATAERISLLQSEAAWLPGEIQAWATFGDQGWVRRCTEALVAARAELSELEIAPGAFGAETKQSE